MKTTSQVTLYDLMASDHTVWFTKNKVCGFDLQIENDDGETVVDEKSIHPYAMEGMADFCRRYLACYEKYTKDAA